MAELVDHLAELTGFRDRDVMDTTLVSAIRDLLKPRMVAIYRLVGEDDARHWLTRARLGANDAAAQADPLWVDLNNLPRREDHPQRLAALEQNDPVVALGEPVVTVFALTTDRDVVGVVEIETTAAIDPEHLRLVGSILRIYRNFQTLLDYSERDTLTGLLNRKTYDEAFYKVMAATMPPAGDQSSDRRADAHDGPLGRLEEHDDVGLGQVKKRGDEPTAAHTLYNLIDRRHTRASTAVTSNIALSEWWAFLGDATLTAAILDRLAMHAVRIDVDGPSYRQHVAKGRTSKRSKPA